MREILFRGKRVDNGEWVYGSYVQQYGATMIYLPDGVDSEHGFDSYHVDPATVGQFTGLTDKNGVKIFEGDIVEYDEELHSVVYEPDVGMFELCGNGFVADFSYIDSSIFCEVVGNIHDNPEMLEVSE